MGHRGGLQRVDNHVAEAAGLSPDNLKTAGSKLRRRSIPSIRPKPRTCKDASDTARSLQHSCGHGSREVSEAGQHLPFDSQALKRRNTGAIPSRLDKVSQGAAAEGVQISTSSSGPLKKVNLDGQPGNTGTRSSLKCIPRGISTRLRKGRRGGFARAALDGKGQQHLPMR
jgi:hypothetical protein